MSDGQLRVWSQQSMSGEMKFRVAVRAYENAFGHFLGNSLVAPIREVPKIKLESLGRRIGVVPCQSSTVPAVAAARATPTKSGDPARLPRGAPLGLREVILVPAIRIGILADT